MKQENRKQSYLPPQLTVVTFAAERGFAQSEFNQGTKNIFRRDNFDVGEGRDDNGGSGYSLWG